MNYEEYKKELEGSTLGRDQLDKALGQNNIEVSDSPKRSFDQYIEQLSQSQLSRDKFDALLKKMRITYSVDKYDDYSYAVINWFRWSKSDFNTQEETKYVSKILNWADKTAESLKKWILEVWARLTEVQEAQKTLKSMPKEVLTLVKWEIDTIESKQKDYNNKTIQNLGKKADKEHKHRATEIIWLETIVRSIEDKIEDRPTRDELSEVLDKKFITKDNTYTKEETKKVINDKLKEIVIPWNWWGWSNSSWWSWDVTWPASSTDWVPALFDWTTWKLLKNSTPTGTGNPVLQTSPSFVTSIIWSATMAVMNTVSTVINAFGAATTLNIGWTPTTAVTHTYSGNATATAETKTVNLGTGWASWSTTNVNIWSANGWTTNIASPTLQNNWVVVPTISSTSTLSNKRLTKPIIDGSVQWVTSDTDWATITFDMASSNMHTVTLWGNRTLVLSNVSVGQVFTIRLQQDATWSRTVTWFTTIKRAWWTAPTLTTTASKADLLIFVCTGSWTYDWTVAMSNL